MIMLQKYYTQVEVFFIIFVANQNNLYLFKFI